MQSLISLPPIFKKKVCLGLYGCWCVLVYIKCVKMYTNTNACLKGKKKSKQKVWHCTPKCTLKRQTIYLYFPRSPLWETVRRQMSILLCTCKSQWLSGFKQKHWWRISRCHSPASIYITDNRRSYIPGFNLANIIDHASPGPRRRQICHKT